MVNIFRSVSVALAMAAIYFYWLGNSDWLYASIVLACVAFFLSIRTEVKSRNDIREQAIRAEQDLQSEKFTKE